MYNVRFTKAELRAMLAFLQDFSGAFGDANAPDHTSALYYAEWKIRTALRKSKGRE